MRLCPVCQTAMTTAPLGSVQIDECPRGHGAWFEDQELRIAKDEADPDLSWMDFEIWKHPDRFALGTSRLACPDCKTPLVQVQYTDTPVTIDCCPSCHGIWLDKGEFPRVIEALEHEVTTKTFSDYVKASVSEAREIVTGPESALSEWRDFRAVLRLLRFRFFVEHQGLSKLLTRIPRIG